jgi:hypothetical protein
VNRYYARPGEVMDRIGELEGDLGAMAVDAVDQ